MILYFIMLLSLAYGQDQSIEEYCFSSSEQMKHAHSRLKFILVPADQTQENQNCLTVNTPGHRRELIQNFIRRIDPSVKIDFSSSELKREHCRIKVEKIIDGRNQSQGASANTNLHPSLTAGQENRQSNTVSSIQTMKDFELTVRQDSIKGECRFINPTRYEISLEVRKDAKPLLPPVPPGTIVVVPDAQIPQDQDTAKLQTTVQLNFGERLELGSIVKSLKNKNTKLDVNSGAAFGNAEEIGHEKVYLSIE